MDSAYQNKKAASGLKSGLFEIWLRQVDEFRSLDEKGILRITYVQRRKRRSSREAFLLYALATRISASAASVKIAAETSEGRPC